MVTSWHISTAQVAPALALRAAQLKCRPPAATMIQPNASAIVASSPKIQAQPRSPPHSRALHPTLLLYLRLPRRDFLSAYRRHIMINQALPISDGPQPKIESYTSQRYPPRSQYPTTPLAPNEGGCGTRIDLASHALKLGRLSRSDSGSRLSTGIPRCSWRKMVKYGVHRLCWCCTQSDGRRGEDDRDASDTCRPSS